MDQQHTNQDKRRDSLIQLALSRAASAFRAITALGNFQCTTNPNQIGPINAAQFAGAAFTTKVSGRVLILAYISGTAQAVDQTVTIQLFKDASPIGGSITVSAGHTTADFGQFIAIVDPTVGAGVKGTHTYSIVATNTTGGQNVTVPTGAAMLTLIEWPT